MGALGVAAEGAAFGGGRGWASRGGVGALGRFCLARASVSVRDGVRVRVRVRARVGVGVRVRG